MLETVKFADLKKGDQFQVTISHPMQTVKDVNSTGMIRTELGPFWLDSMDNNYNAPGKYSIVRINDDRSSRKSEGTMKSEETMNTEETLRVEGTVAYFDLKIGDVISVLDQVTGKTYERVTVKYVGRSGGLDATREDGSSVRIPTGSNPMKIVRFRKLPDNWPPQTGDVWRSPTGSECYVTTDSLVVFAASSMANVATSYPMRYLISDAEKHGVKYVLKYRKNQ